MALTSRLHRCRSPRRNRGIPTILAQRFDGGIVDVSAVDTGLPVGSTPRDLGAGAGLTLPCPAPARPLRVPTQRPGGTDATSAPARTRPEEVYCTRVGIYWPGVVPTARILHEGPTYLEYPRPSFSRSPLSCITSQASPEPLRAAEPAPASAARKDHWGPIRPPYHSALGSPDSARSGGRSCSGPLRRCLRRHDIRKSQKS